MICFHKYILAVYITCRGVGSNESCFCFALKFLCHVTVVRSEEFFVAGQADPEAELFRVFAELDSGQPKLRGVENSGIALRSCAPIRFDDFVLEKSRLNDSRQ